MNVVPVQYAQLAEAEAGDRKDAKADVGKPIAEAPIRPAAPLIKALRGIVRSS
jgi:hypothetical protein